jgi:hypothetical protein
MDSDAIIRRSKVVELPEGEMVESELSTPDLPRLTYGSRSYFEKDGGPSIRLELASRFMAAYIMSKSDMSSEKICRRSLKFADGLIAEANATRGESRGD